MNCRQESFFAYLFGVREPGFYGAIVSVSVIGQSVLALDNTTSTKFLIVALNLHELLLFSLMSFIA